MFRVGTSSSVSDSCSNSTSVSMPMPSSSSDTTTRKCFLHPAEISVDTTAEVNKLNMPTTEVNAPESPVIINFDLGSLEELPVTNSNDVLDSDHNKENINELSDKDITNYMQLFEKNITKGGMFQGCTVNINNPVFNITIQK